MFGFELDESENSKAISFIDDVKNIEGTRFIVYKKVKFINIKDLPGFTSVIESSSKMYDNHGFIWVLNAQKTVV